MLLLGALSKDHIRDGEVWRLLTYGFGHMSFIHFLLNMPILLILSRPLEKYFGSKIYAVIYSFLIVIPGIFVVLFYTGQYPLAGSLGVGFGLLGIYLYMLLRWKYHLTTYDKNFIIFFLVFAMIFTFSVPDISVSGHIGGLFTGFILMSIYSVIKKFIL
ncbi:rhomboid protease GluP [Piscibacillus halophilus]|uniref:Rhomboid protease GluP n=1 Tax=Piscibacillus halophilus TaxID=571933 RepID=A0A1H9JT29_9BACI|nr:rhomboid protease GluP [Piscibacillus halophilus]